MIAQNSDPGDTNAVFVKPFFQTPPAGDSATPYSHISNFYCDVFASWWQPMGAGGAIPYHVLLDMDGYARGAWLGGHGANADQFYEPYVKNLLGLP